MPTHGYPIDILIETIRDGDLSCFNYLYTLLRTPLEAKLMKALTAVSQTYRRA